MTGKNLEKIAIVGLGCKVPGADNAEEFWKLLKNGENHVIEIPKDRWNHAAYYDENRLALEKTYAHKAGLLKRPLGFDNELFNINDFEADQMDPQQRYALECSYMALEDAGMTRKDYEGSNTAVFVGVMCNDYGGMFAGGTSIAGNYTVTGTAPSVIAARVSFTFDLQGPAMTADTACSSGLVAVHLGVMSLRGGDCDMALCGGTNSILAPDTFIHLSKAGMISAKGQCFAFSDQVDGYTRGEGGGMVILKRLSDAQRDGNKIWGIIETGWNQDGRTVTPISRPSEKGQRCLLERVYSNIDLDLKDIDYIEAHGTGTPVGDVVETNVLGQFFRDRHAERPRHIGSVKTNIGHLESAAGIVGLIKVLLMMKHSKIVPSLFSETLNPKIDFQGMKFNVPQTVLDWSTPRKVACVNSFGFGGTNCHAVIQGYMEPLTEQNNVTTDQIKNAVICFSAKNKESLIGSIQMLVDHPDLKSFSIHDVSYTSIIRREHYPEVRLAMIGVNTEEISTGLKKRLTNFPAEENEKQNRHLVFVFCGMGSSWVGMCKEMMATNPTFLEAIHEISECLHEHVEWSLEERMATEKDMSDLVYWPIAIFACQIALARFWKSLGVTPDCVIGYSMGEVAAAQVAGRLTLKDAVSVIYFRSVRLAEIEKTGKMILIRHVPIEKVREAVETFQREANISAEISPVCCAVSGTSDAVKEIQEKLQQQHGLDETSFIDLDLPVAYHSHCVDPSKDKLRQDLGGILRNPDLPVIDMISTVTKKRVDSPLDEEYWVDNMREPVYFREAVTQSFSPQRNNIYIEIGPRHMMAPHVKDIFPNAKANMVISMKKDAEWKTVLQAVAKLFEEGLDIKWEKFPMTGTLLTPVPRYCFHYRSGLQFPENGLKTLLGMKQVHPFVCKVQHPDTMDEYKIVLSKSLFPSVYDHVVSSQLIVPGAIYAELGLAIVKLTPSMKAPHYSLSVSFEQPCAFTDKEPVILNTCIKKIASCHSTSFSSYTIDVNKDTKTYAKIQLIAHAEKDKQPGAINIQHVRSRCPQRKDRDKMYQELKALGFRYGPNYSLMVKAHRNSQECIVEIHVPHSIAQEQPGTSIHPSILDAMIQTFIIMTDDSSKPKEVLPLSIGELIVYERTEERMYIYTKLKRTNGNLTVFDVKLTTCSGVVIADMKDLVFRFLSGETVSADMTKEILHKSVWEEMITSDKLKKDTKSTQVLYITEKGSKSAADLPLGSTIIFFSVSENGSVEMEKDADKKIKDRHFKFLLVYIDINLDDNEDGRSVLAKTVDLCMLLKNICTHGHKLPVYLFTRWALSPDLDQTVTERINPISSALWGMARCAQMEQAASLTILDLHQPKERCTLEVMTCVADYIFNNNDLKMYLEWIVTEDALFVRQTQMWSPKMDMPLFRTVSADQSRNVVPICRVPGDIENSLNIYYEEHETITTLTYVEINVSENVIQNPALFSVSIPCSSSKDRTTLPHHGYIEFNLENVGTAQARDSGRTQTVVSCYPSPVGSKIKVPAQVTVAKDLLDDYRPGDLTKLVMLWSLREYINTDSVTILASSSSMGLGLALMSIVNMKQVNIISTEQLTATHALNKTIISLVLLDETVISDLEKCSTSSVERLVTVSDLIDHKARSIISYRMPTCQLIKTDPSVVFHHANLIQVVPKIKKWLQGKSQFLRQSIENPVENSDVTNDLSQLLRVKSRTADKSTVFVPESDLFRKDALYIVVGGLTGLGWIYVELFAQNGAGNIAIINRRQADAARQKDIELLGKKNHCSIKAFQADVTQMSSLRACMDVMSKQFPKVALKGIFFGAAFLRDKMLIQSERADFEAVMSPKILGTWNMHQLTRHLSLDYFLLHSSVASAIGNVSQSNYAAGNAFMDGLVHYRRQLRLPGQSINWGPLKDLGLMLGNDKAEEILSRSGLILLTKEDIASVMKPILMLNRGQILACRFNPGIWKGARFTTALNTESQGSLIEDKLRDTLHKAHELSPKERVSLYERFIAVIVSKILGTQKSQIQPQTNLRDLGLDSLMAMTLIVEVHREIQYRLSPIILVTGDPTVRAIAQKIDEDMHGDTVNT